MKNIFLSTLFIAFTGILLSVQTTIDENNLIGTWKVNKAGMSRSTKGDVLITFTSDHKSFSEKTSSGRIKTGKWYYIDSTNELIIQGEDDDDEKLILQSLSASKMEILNGEKTIILDKTKTITYE